MQEKIIWTPKRVKVSDLKPWKKNPRNITTESFERLKNKIREHGNHGAIVVDTDLTTLSGSQRTKAFKDLGIKEVMALIPHRKLTEQEREKIALESNICEGTWDTDSLFKNFALGSLKETGLLELNELQSKWAELLEVKNDDFNEVEEIKKIKVPQTKLGDLIILGSHKLICGDSTDPNVIKKLFGKEKCSMIYSDPVYNLKGGVSYSSGVGGKKNYGGHVNDNRSDVEYEEFLKKSLENALSVAEKDVHVFYWSDSSYIWLIQTLFRRLGITNKRVCLWIKQGQNPTPGTAFSKCFEPCTYGVIGKPYISPNIQNLNEVMNGEMTTGNQMFDQINNCLDIWTEKRLSGKEMEHATSKPPKLASKPIRRCTKVNDIILDSFSGSASTMVAAEMLGRKVYAVELEPLYCELAIRRWEKLTGKKVKVIKAYEKE